jgi:hypothetical protein
LSAAVVVVVMPLAVAQAVISTSPTLIFHQEASQSQSVLVVRRNTTA